MAAISYGSAYLPLLERLHTRLTAHEEAVMHAYKIASQYRAPLVDMETTSLAFDSVLEHCTAVDELTDRDYVLLHRDCLSPTNVLFDAPPDPKVPPPRRRIVTRSPILMNSSGLELKFEPQPSREVCVRHTPSRPSRAARPTRRLALSQVLLHSSILANSAAMRAVSMITL